MGAWQRGRLRLPVKQSPTGHGGSNPSAPTSHTGLAQLAERRSPKPKVRGSIPWSGARHLDVAKWLKAAACKAAGVSPHPFALGGAADQDVAQQRAEGRAQRAIGSSSPDLVSSADESSRLLPGGSAVRIGHEVPVHFPDSADGRAPGC